MSQEINLDAIEDGQTIALPIMFRNKDNTVNKVTITAKRKGERLWLQYPYNKQLTEQLKVCLSGMKYHGFDEVNPVKQWSCRYDEHSIFQLSHLSGLRPYDPFSRPPKDFVKHFPLKQHQYEGVGMALNTRRAIWAYEMGLGKTLMAFELATQLNVPAIHWVSTKSAIISVKIQAKEWGFKIPIFYYTYEGFKNAISNWEGHAPIMLVGDESQKLKNLTAQRTQSFNYAAKCMRKEHGKNAVIILMSGTPSPKAPVDWFSQCHIVQPGFLKEGDIYKLKERLAVTKQNDKASFIELVTWRDDERKCNFCGKLASDYEHDIFNLNKHTFVPSVNEVANLYKRLSGLVTVKLKKDCTDLPEKIFQRIHCKPSTKTLQAARLIAARTKGAVKTLTLLRELSDGFQYSMEASQTQTCPTCKGKKCFTLPVYVGPEKTENFIKSIDEGYDPSFCDPEDYIISPDQYPDLFEIRTDAVCPTCEGEGIVPLYIRHTNVLTTSKDKAVVDLLDEYDDIGRFVLFAAFNASLEKLRTLILKQGWDYIKMDGKGFVSSLTGSKEELLEAFQSKGNQRPARLVYLANPGSGSTGLTLTASPVATFYSNSFNGEDRMQAMDRIHRLGMDENRGAKIIDLIHLPTDEYILDNLDKKIKLQAITMGDIIKAADTERNEYDYEAE